MKTTFFRGKQGRARNGLLLGGAVGARRRAGPSHKLTFVDFEKTFRLWKKSAVASRRRFTNGPWGRRILFGQGAILGTPPPPPPRKVIFHSLPSVDAKRLWRLEVALSSLGINSTKY